MEIPICLSLNDGISVGFFDLILDIQAVGEGIFFHTFTLHNLILFLPVLDNEKYSINCFVKKEEIFRMLYLPRTHTNPCLCLSVMG